MAQQLVRRRFTADEFHLMADGGVFGEDDRVELLEGEVVEMSPIGSRHAACVAKLTASFAAEMAGRAIVWVQNPIRLDEWSEPQPDLTLLRPHADFYASGHPTAIDVFLLVEVADTSAAADRSYKLPLYAAAGVEEVWLVDLAAGAVEVWSGPTETGFVTSRRAIAGDVLAPGAFPDVTLAVDDLLT